MDASAGATPTCAPAEKMRFWTVILPSVVLAFCVLAHFAITCAILDGERVCTAKNIEMRECDGAPCFVVYYSMNAHPFHSKTLRKTLPTEAEARAFSSWLGAVPHACPPDVYTTEQPLASFFTVLSLFCLLVIVLVPLMSVERPKTS